MRVRLQLRQVLAVVVMVALLWAAVAVTLYALLPIGTSVLPGPAPLPRYNVARIRHPSRVEIHPDIEYGVFLMDFANDPHTSLDRARALGVEWVAVEVRWGEWLFFPNTPLDWSALDRFMTLAGERGLRVMVRLVTSPAWSNPKGTIDAPPADPEQFGAFASELATRYAGTLGAVEVWAGQNAQNAWDAPDGLAPEAYVMLLKATYRQVKLANPAVTIISGALQAGDPPAGGDPARPAFVAEEEFFSEFVRHGGLGFADCIGMQHLEESAPSEALAERIPVYERLANRQVPLCLTAFGVPSPPNVPAGAAGQAQADRLAEGVYNLARPDSPAVGLVVVFDLDAAAVSGNANAPGSPFSLLDPTGQPRAAYFRPQELLQDPGQ